MKKLIFGIWCLGFGICSLWAVNLPELPRAYVDTTFDPAYNRPADIVVKAGDNFQAALNAIQPGQIIELEAGATFRGNFRFHKKNGDAWIYIRSSALNQFPVGSRVGFGQAHLMPKLEQSNPQLPPVIMMFGAHHYRLAGIEVRTDAATNDLVRTGYGLDDPQGSIWGIRGARTVEELQHHIIFDRMLIHSTSEVNRLRHGIMLNGLHMAVIDSTIANCKDRSDAMAIWTILGDGPYKIVNNFLEGTGENVLFGGTDPAIINSVPSDIEIQGNHFYKRPSWRVSNLWVIKNLFELKNAQRVFMKGNILEHNWASGQNGTAILFTVRNQNGTAPWSVVQDVTFESNIVRHTAQGFQILYEDYNYPSQPTKRIRIANNVLEDLDTEYNGGNTYFLQGGVDDLIVSHNLLLHRSGGGSGLYALPGGSNRIIENNIYTHGQYNADSSILAIRNNAIILEPNDRYSWNKSHFNEYYPGNFLVDPSRDLVGFTNYAGGDYRLAPSSPYKNRATDGSDLGPDFNVLEAATECTITGACNGAPPTPPPSPPTPKPPHDNPTSPTTDVELFKNLLNLTEGTPMTIPCERNVRIVSRSGDLVRELSCDGDSTDWDGKHQSGQRVSAGIYILLEEKKSNRKVVVLK